jgi:hypothetical protein
MAWRLIPDSRSTLPRKNRFKAAIDDCLDKMATEHKHEAATLFTHKFQRFGDVPFLAA